MTNADADVEFQSCSFSRSTYEERLFEPKDLPWRGLCNMMERNLSRYLTLIPAVLMFP
jgi:hypothetical protein